MSWSPKPLEIGPLDGFEGTDLFQYKAFGQHLARLIGSLEDDPVLLLDGPWGSGKTTFARQWAGVLRKQGHAVVHFDAFAADHHKDPFLVLVEEIHCLASEASLAPDSQDLDSFTKGAVAVAKELSLASLEATIPGAGRILGLAIEAGSRSDPSLLEQWLQQAAARKGAVREFRQHLTSVAAALTAETRVKQDADVVPRLVFIVDELDRCRPLFALAVLERIKHIFGVPQVCFVLVANVNELGKCIRQVYGAIDVERYLEKFFEIRVQLPGDTATGIRAKAGRYARYLFDQLGLPRDGYYDQDFLQGLTRLAESENLSLRTLEHAMRSAWLLSQTGDPSVTAFLSVVRVTAPSLFSSLVRGEPDLVSEEDANAFVSLWKVFGSGRDPREVLSSLGPTSELTSYARLLAQFRF